ncbi:MULTISPECIES: hypothetical protein [Acinetobacter calcoaceticus/baumannii complex]|uniref:GapS4a family protein n=1 Tax=Acinetobacter calcoaceticus/baumannii complex TaxID=909768 RepID=UPI00197E92C0|nr:MULTISPECIES: hypothetical protein [Acinetobacter calcoaceticus/baumannii complex]MBN6514757.1 hypothetical protein [Acinetobacter pittii]MDH2520672.1 hypothetical protein [Acinetobacter baumannii]
MGELSKTSGENGEKLTEELLKLMGWKNFMRGINVTCNKPLHNKETHGNDFFYIYHNPLHDQKTDIVYISTKNSSKGYPPGSQGTRTKLKKHVLELESIIDCSKISPEINSAVNSFSCRKQKRHFGMLFWWHGNKEQIDRDIKQDLSAIQMDLGAKHPIYLIDMARATFIKDAITHFRSSTHGTYNFYYPKLGSIVISSDERYGPILPIELIASDIIPIRFMIDDQPALCLYAKQNFSEEVLKKLCSLALDFADAWVKNIFIGLENYHPADDRHKKDEVLMSFQEREADIKVFCYKQSVLDLLEV